MLTKKDTMGDTSGVFVDVDYYNKVLNELFIEIDEIKNNITDELLLNSDYKEKNVYSMSYDEYVELPYRSRL